MQLDRIKKNFKEIIERFKLAQEVPVLSNIVSRCYLTVPIDSSA